MKRTGRLTGAIVIALVVSWIFAQSVAAASAPLALFCGDFGDCADHVQCIGFVAGPPEEGAVPETTVTRCDMARIITVCLGLTGQAVELAGPTSFPDVTPDHWATGFVNAAAATGAIQGYTDGLFRPDAPVTLAEAVTMLVRAVGWEPADADWPDSYLKIASAKGITGGLTYLASDEATQSSVVIMASRTVFGVPRPDGTTLGAAYGVDRPMRVFHTAGDHGGVGVVVTSTANLLVIDDSFLSAAAELAALAGSIPRPATADDAGESGVAIDAGVPTFLAALDPRAAVLATGFQRTLPVTVTVPADGSSFFFGACPPAPAGAPGGVASTAAGGAHPRPLAAGPPNCMVLPAGEYRMRFNARAQVIEAGYVPWGEPGG